MVGAAWCIPAQQTPFTVTNSDGSQLTIMLCGGLAIAVALRRCPIIQSIFFPNTLDDFTLAWRKLFQRLNFIPTTFK